MVSPVAALTSSDVGAERRTDSNVYSECSEVDNEHDECEDVGMMRIITRFFTRIVACAIAGCRWPLACSRCTTHALCVPAGLLAASAVQPAICALHSAARRLDLRSLSEHRDQLTS